MLTPLTSVRSERFIANQLMIEAYDSHYLLEHKNWARKNLPAVASLASLSWRRHRPHLAADVPDGRPGLCIVASVAARNL
jgi:hypothetical protein